MVRSKTTVSRVACNTNIPQYNGARERDGRTLAGIVRCHLTDSGLPKFLWGKLMQTTACLAKRVRHAALGNMVPYECIYSEGNLGYIRGIDARALVHVEMRTKKLDP